MKHLKSYETIEDAPPKFKKYVVFNLVAGHEFFVDTIIKYTDNEKEHILIYKMSYKYNDKFNILQNHDNSNEVKQTTRKEINDYIKYVIFTSDNLDDCLNFIRLKIQTNKYNI